MIKLRIADIIKIRFILIQDTFRNCIPEARVKNINICKEALTKGEANIHFLAKLNLRFNIEMWRRRRYL